MKTPGRAVRRSNLRWQRGKKERRGGGRDAGASGEAEAPEAWTEGYARGGWGWTPRPSRTAPQHADRQRQGPTTEARVVAGAAAVGGSLFTPEARDRAMARAAEPSGAAGDQPSSRPPSPGTSRAPTPGSDSRVRLTEASAAESSAPSTGPPPARADHGDSRAARRDEPSASSAQRTPPGTPRPVRRGRLIPRYPARQHGHNRRFYSDTRARAAAPADAGEAARERPRAVSLREASDVQTHFEQQGEGRSRPDLRPAPWRAADSRTRTTSRRAPSTAIRRRRRVPTGDERPESTGRRDDRRDQTRSARGGAVSGEADRRRAEPEVPRRRARDQSRDRSEDRGRQQGERVRGADTRQSMAPRGSMPDVFERVGSPSVHPVQHGSRRGRGKGVSHQDQGRPHVKGGGKRPRGDDFDESTSRRPEARRRELHFVRCD